MSKSSRIIFVVVCFRSKYLSTLYIACLYLLKTLYNTPEHYRTLSNYQIGYLLVLKIHQTETSRLDIFLSIFLISSVTPDDQTEQLSVSIKFNWIYNILLRKINKFHLTIFSKSTLTSKSHYHIGQLICISIFILKIFLQYNNGNKAKYIKY